MDVEDGGRGVESGGVFLILTFLLFKFGLVLTCQYPNSYHGFLYVCTRGCR